VAAEDPRDPDEPTTQPLGSVGSAEEHQLAEPPFAAGTSRKAVVRLFGSDSFFRLWIAQVVSALGDWIGFLAVIAIATRVGGDSPAAAISLVMSARMIPGFFLAPVAGVLVDRWDRKKVMVACDVLRGGVLCTLPFIDHVWTLVLASLVLEIGTLLWSPAKEASVPNLVPSSHLATANSLSLVAAYGTFPVATLLFAFLAKVATWLSHIGTLDFLKIDQEFIAVYLDVLTFGASALLISSLTLRHRTTRDADDAPIGFEWGHTLHQLREGWRFMFINPTVRSVMIGIGTGLIGGGMVVPLGDLFSRSVLGGGSAGFGLLLTGMGVGMAAGVVLVSAMQSRLPKARVFCWAVLVAGIALIGGASMGTLYAAIIFVAVLGVCAGTVYVLGFTILQETVADELRGRIFAALYTLVRFCLLLSFAVGPLLAETLGRVSKRFVNSHVVFLGLDIELPGVRLALWLAGVIILGAGLLAVTSLRAIDREPSRT
jgi:dTMP kinase